MSKKGDTQKGNSKERDVRMSNIVAAKGAHSLPISVYITNYIDSIAVADTIRTSLGPRGMDKMIQKGSQSLSYLLICLFIT